MCMIPHPKGMHHSSLEGVEEAEGTPIGWDKDELPIVAELESCPLARTVVLQLEGSKRALLRSKQNKNTLKMAIYHWPPPKALNTNHQHKHTEIEHTKQRIHHIHPFLKTPNSHSPEMNYLVKGPQVIQFDHLRVHASSKDQTLRIKWANWLPL